MNVMKEFRARGVPGFLALVLGIFFFGLVIFLMTTFAPTWGFFLPVPLMVPLIILFLRGFFVVQPNEARIITFFGKYHGTIKEAGFWWINPFASKQKMSLRIHNFNSVTLKVNDAQGNPIEIAAVIVWRVEDTARALFDIQNYEQFVTIQSETALRTVAAQYPYDAHDHSKASLRGNTLEISEKLQQEVQKRLDIAGIEIYDACISHLAYAPEIAHAMLRRQQAEAIVAARQKIVEGAVDIVDSALRLLSEEKGIKLSEEKKALMINNLLVTLVAEREAQPFINTGIL